MKAERPETISANSQNERFHSAGQNSNGQSVAVIQRVALFFWVSTHDLSVCQVCHCLLLVEQKRQFFHVRVRCPQRSILRMCTETRNFKWLTLSGFFFS